MNNQNKDNSNTEALKSIGELLYSIGTLIMLIPVLIIMINVFLCSNNNYIDNPEITETIKHTGYSEEKITERLTSNEKDLIKSFIPDKYFKTISSYFDANYPNANGTNDIMVTIENNSFDNVDSCIEVFKTFINDIYDNNMNKKIGGCNISYIGSKNGKLTNMIWIEDIYNKSLNEAIASIEIKTFNNDNKSGMEDGTKSKETTKLTNEEIKQQLYTFFNNYTDNSTMVVVDESSYLGETDWIVSFACGAIVDVPLVKENGGQFAYATEWQDWTDQVILR